MGSSPYPSNIVLAASATRILVAAVMIGLILEPMIWRGMLSPDRHDGAASQVYGAATASKPEIASYSLQDIPVPVGADAIVMADRLLLGQDFMEGFGGSPYALPFTDKARVSDWALKQAVSGMARAPVVYALPFSAGDLVRDDGIGALPYSSLYLVDVLLNAYAAKPDARYLQAALQMTLAFSRFEQSRWRTVGFIWNDHAVATRAGVMTRLWLAYRASPMYEPVVASELLSHAARLAELMSSPRDFNVRTNHGVMQNVALMQLVLAFPVLDQDRHRWRTAMERLDHQVAFLYARDGFVLEHSAHYHDVGVKLLEMAVNLVELAGEPVPDLWRERLASSLDRLADVTRPDGTLAAYGDTELEFWPPGRPAPTVRKQDRRFQVFPLSGYAVSAFGGSRPSHTTVAWSHNRGHGHKLADEMSVLLWADRGWITNTGYWDYSGWGRPFAEGWRGSNAPHWSGESPKAERETRLVAHAHDDVASHLSLVRRNGDSSAVARDIVHLARGLWLVVDRSEGKLSGSTETLWTFFPDVTVEQARPGSYVVTDATGRRLHATFASTDVLDVGVVRGSRQPFGGWVTVGREGVPAPAVATRAVGGAVTASLFRADGNATDAPFIFSADGGSRWMAAGEDWAVEREGDEVRIRDAGRTSVLRPIPPSDVQQQRIELESSLHRAMKRYPREVNLDVHREKIVFGLAGVLLVQELLLALALASGNLRPVVRRHALMITVVLVFAWLAGGLWLHHVYLKVPAGQLISGS